MEFAEWIEGDEGVAAQRAKARNLLPQITQQVKQALEEASIEIDVFLMIPATGDAIATFGTLADPPDELWIKRQLPAAEKKAAGAGGSSSWLVASLPINGGPRTRFRIGEIVCSIVRRAVGLDRVCSRPLSCATTADEMINSTDAMPTTIPAALAAGDEV